MQVARRVERAEEHVEGCVVAPLVGQDLGLRQVSDELASTKGRMDERGTSMTDTSPLIKIKSALSRLKDERKSMDVRIGVVTHTLVAKKLKHDQHTKNEAARPKNTHVAADDAGFDDEMED